MPTTSAATAAVIACTNALLVSTSSGAEMRAANLTVTELSEPSGLSRRKLVRRLAGAPLKASELAALGLVLGRRPSQWFAVAERVAR